MQPQEMRLSAAEGHAVQAAFRGLARPIEGEGLGIDLINNED